MPPARLPLAAGAEHAVGEVEDEEASRLAERARGAEDSSKLARRLARLRRRAKVQRAERAQLSLPGVG